MRRRWGLAAFLCSLVVSPAARAQSEDVVASAPAADEPAPVQAIGYGALPGGLLAPSAQGLPKGSVAVATLGGFGWRSGLLAENHRFGRGIGTFAIGFAPHELVTVALSLDGRYDRHFGLPTSGDDGYVGDPRVLVRVAKPVGNLRVGGQLGVWIPGRDAPSLVASAISFDARALVSLPVGPGLLSVSAGFRVDNSSKSVVDADGNDNRHSLSFQDRVSLGVSEFHAVLAGAQLALPFGKAFLGLEANMDLFVGAGDTPMGSTEAHEATGPILRFGATAGYHVTPAVSVLAFVQGAKVPAVDAAELAANDLRLVPYEAMISGGVGLQARFGGSARRGTIRENAIRADVAVVETADLSGEIVDDTGKPVVGAKVEVKLANVTGTGVTDAQGVFVVERLPIGKTVGGVTTLDDTAAEIHVAVDGKKPATETLTLAKGANTAPKLTLEPLLPPGQLRGLVRSVVSGKPLAGAAITVEPGGAKVTANAEGKFEIDLPPGQYRITVSSPGLAAQKLDVTIDPNGVAIKNIELHK